MLHKYSSSGFWFNSVLTKIVVQRGLSYCNADNYIPRQIRVCHPADDDFLLDNITAVPDRNGCNGTIRPRETSCEVFSLERDKADMIIVVLSMLLRMLHIQYYDLILQHSLALACIRDFISCCGPHSFCMDI